MKYPSRFLHGFLCLTIPAYNTFYTKSGLPFLQETKTISPTEAEASLFKATWIFLAKKIFKVLAQELSAQFMTNLGKIFIFIKEELD